MHASMICRKCSKDINVNKASSIIIDGSLQYECIEACKESCTSTSKSLLKEYFGFPVICHTFENFLSPSECLEWIKESETMKYEDACITSYTGEQILDKSVINCLRLYVDNETAKLNLLWSRILEKTNNFVFDGFDCKSETDYCSNLSNPVGLNPKLRFLKYLEGHYFKRHYDANYEHTMEDGTRACSYLTAQLYLNDDYEGGSIKFVDDSNSPPIWSCDYKPKQGSLIIFDQELLHEGTPVK